MVQYEAFIKDRWHPIVRYDTAHGFPHRALLHPNQPTEKIPFPERDNAEILTLGQEDIRRNWIDYRARYEQEMKK